MLVSAISQNTISYRMSGNMPYYDSHSDDTIGDTAFNSLAPSRRLVSAEKLPQVFDNINEWQNFCHQQIMNGKLDVIA